MEIVILYGGVAILFVLVAILIVAVVHLLDWVKVLADGIDIDRERVDLLEEDLLIEIERRRRYLAQARQCIDDELDDEEVEADDEK